MDRIGYCAELDDKWSLGGKEEKVKKEKIEMKERERERRKYAYESHILREKKREGERERK